MKKKREKSEQSSQAVTDDCGPPKKKVKRKHKDKVDDSAVYQEEIDPQAENNAQPDTPKKKKKKLTDVIPSPDEVCANTIADNVSSSSSKKKKKKYEDRNDEDNQTVENDNFEESKSKSPKKKKNKKHKKSDPESKSEHVEMADLSGNSVNAEEGDSVHQSKKKKKKSKKQDGDEENGNAEGQECHTENNIRTGPDGGVTDSESSEKKKKKKKKKKKAKRRRNEDDESVKSTGNDEPPITEEVEPPKKKNKEKLDCDHQENGISLGNSVADNEDEQMEFSPNELPRKKKKKDKKKDKNKSSEYQQTESSLHKTGKGDSQQNRLSSAKLGQQEANNKPNSVNNNNVPFAGQWSTADLGNSDRQNKFLRLLGGFKKGNDAKPDGLLGNSAKKVGGNHALGGKGQSELNQKLEKQFQQAMTFKLNKHRGGGIGFQPDPSEGKKFHIDAHKSTSLKFDD